MKLPAPPTLLPAAVRAELAKLGRRRLLVGAALAAAVFAAVATVSVFLAAEPASPAAPGRGVTLDALTGPGGATQAFATGASFAGLFVLVAFVANVAGEFSHGTVRTLLLRHPGRARLLAGKTVALLAFTAGVLAVAEALAVAASVAMAPSQGVGTAGWFGTAGLRAAAADYGTALAAATAWGLLGTALGVLVRSTPLALGVAVAWAGPFEHLLQDAWAAASRWFPGLLVEALAAGGTPEVSQARAAAMVAVYVVTAATAALVVFARRDVTS